MYFTTEVYCYPPSIVRHTADSLCAGRFAALTSASVDKTDKCRLLPNWVYARAVA